MAFATKRRDSSKAFLILGCVLFPALVVLSFLPEGEKYAMHTTGRFHLLGHFLAFLVMGFIAFRAGGSGTARTVLVAMTLLSGLGIEFAEHLVFRMDTEWLDVAMDSAGALTGAVLAVMSVSRPLPSEDARWRR